MKYVMKYTLALAVMLLFSTVALADNTATVIKKINGEAAGDKDPGKVEYSNGTITVTPAEGYYLTAEDLTVCRVVEADHAQTRTPEYDDSPINITAKDANADPSGKTEYTFTVQNGKLDYEITANFHTRTSLENATVTVAEGPYPYTGNAIEPKVTVKLGDITLTKDVDYTVSYANNTKPGENTAVVTVKGLRTYTGTKSANFTIDRIEADLSWTDPYMGYVMNTFWWGPRLINPNNLDVKYSSDDEEVATIDGNGTVTVVGPGECNISAIFEGNDLYMPKTVSYLLEVTEEYKLWIGSTQVTNENCKDILGDGHFFYDKKNKQLIITDNDEPQVIESRMSDLTIFVNGSSKLERIWFNNEGNDEATGRLYFTSYMNIPGSIDFSTNDANGVISGFSNIGLDEDAFLYLLDPKDGAYQAGKLVTNDGAIAQTATIGQYLRPLVEGHTVKFPPGQYSGVDLTNVVINDILNTLVQHQGDSDEDDDYYDPAESAIVLNNVNTTSGMTLLLFNVEKGDLIPGSEEYAIQFRGGLTFMIPDGEGKITLDVQTEPRFKLMLMIGNTEPKEIVKTERGEVTFKYNVEKPTYCCIYLAEDVDTSRSTRGAHIGKRDTHHGKIHSISVKPAKSSKNPLNEIEGFPEEDIPEIILVQEDPEEPDGIDNMSCDKVGDNKWYNLNGQQIEQPTKKGLYIINRKKAVVK